MVPKMKVAKALVYFAFMSLVAVIASAQTSSVESRIAQPIDESQRVVLHGNVYPLARPEFDRGLAPATMPMEHMWLVLKRSPAQESGLETLLAQQQDKTSPNYHKWLTPAEFGLQYGPSTQDIGTVVQWLTSHGLGVSQVTNGHMALEFSGTAANVQQAFHTEIHMYNVNGEQHYANSTDPEIPAALASVVVGPNALHNFKPRPASHRVTLSANGVPLRRIRPQFTYPSGCNPTSTTDTNLCNFALGPADFGVIYNVASLWSAGTTGAGQKIAVLGQATVNMTDVTTFYSLFGVTPTPPTPIVVGPASPPPPSLAASAASGDEGESDLDLQWSSSVAPGAQVYFVTSGDVGDSAMYAVDTNVIANIIGLSYGLCESSLGAAGNTMYNNLWQQAVPEGITVVVSTGDTLAAGCEMPQSPTPNFNPGPQPATTGLAVSGLASTIYNLAVGGTDFNDANNPTTYWNTSNAANTQLSAKSYIPEITYNDSCTNAIFGEFSGFSTIPLANCNNTSIDFGNLIAPFGGGGGMSNCATLSGSGVCSAGYAKPAWQSAPGVPNDGLRDLPDIAMFAGDGEISGSFYSVCESDQNTGDVPCNLANGDITGFGGTSAAAQVTAGIMALVKQKNSPSTGMGLVNTKLYELASDQASLSCNSSSPASNCVFNQVTIGTIAAPCSVGSPDCGVTASGNDIGIFTGCDTSAGYNLATGLGSVNVANLVNSWSTATANNTADFQLSLQNCNATANITSPGSSGSVSLTITPVNGFTGAYTISCSGLPSESTCSSTQSASGSVTNVTVTVATTAASDVVPSTRLQWPNLLMRIAIPFVGFAVIFIVMSRHRAASRRWAVGLAGAAVICLLLVLGACGGGSGGGGGGGGGGGNGGTPEGFVSGATITVTSGSATHTMSFNVNVE